MIKRGSYGCKDQLSINKTILERKKFIDSMYRLQKGVRQYSTLIYKEEPKIYRVCHTTVKFIIKSMKNWQTTLNLNYTNGSLTSRPINIKSGIFQRDSLSPLLFCLALAPLSCPLNNSSHGYKTQNGKLNHLFYIDDLKTFAKDDNQQKKKPTCHCQNLQRRH